MAELLIKAIDAVHPDAEVDACHCYKQGMPVVVKEDGHQWGLSEGLPKFIVMKIPGVPVERVEKYIAHWSDITDPLKPIPIRRRRWQIRWGALPLAIRTKLVTKGEIIVKALPSHQGPFDVLWNQVKGFVRNHETGLDESEEL